MNEKINHIIAKVLSGESCNSEELLLLTEWLGEDDSRKIEFARLASYWDAEVSLRQNLSSSDLAFEKLWKRINEQGSVQKGKKKIPLHFLFIAASLIIGIVIYTFLYSSDEPSVERFTYVTGNDCSEFSLADGTYVVLNKNSRLVYTDEYGEKERRVQLIGEAYFDVEKDVDKPFIVHTDVGYIIVLGTSFNVKSYVDDSCFIATLIRGSIQFNIPTQSIILAPNEQLRINKKNFTMEIESVDADLDVAWKDGLLKYRSITMSDLIQDLGSRYNVSIKMENEDLKKIIVSGSFLLDDSIDNVLAIMQNNLSFKWKRKNDTILIYK